MKNKLIALLAICTFSSFASIAETGKPTSSLTEAVNLFVSVASNKELSLKEKKVSITEIVKNKMDLPVISKRVISRYWKKANKEDKKEFIGLFTQVIVNTYASLLNQYNNEEVEYLKEVIKKGKYAKVNTNIVLADKKIPVNYKLLLRNDQWRIYDFSAEGVSLISTYTNDYKATLKRSGLAGLNEILKKKVSGKSS
ncbi:MAG: ABC transporter substrate-binding protein [Saccharospirillaceae bacterium]|nr:ABC transporter substrate-binding protein [Colwellia sp.]NRB77321.1 ABC transporter substrate-binding protein [Saccharospirillaceae bacterium]